MQHLGLDYSRQHNFPARYAALNPSTWVNPFSFAQPSIWSAGKPDPHYQKSNPRPQQLNLVLGRVEQANVTPQAEPPKAPPPAPTKGKGGKGAALLAFANSLFSPPIGCSRPDLLGAAMGSGGLQKKPEPE